MLKNILAGIIALMGTIAFAADVSPKEDVQAAAKKLADSANYSWKTTTESGFGTGTEEGKIEKDGVTLLSVTFFDSTTQIVKKGDKGALKMEGAWMSFDEAAKSGEEGQPNPARFIAMMMRNHKAPAAIVQDLIAKSKELKKTDDGWSADLTEEGVKDLLSFGPRREGGPQVTGAKGSAKFWAKDGVISKVEYKLEGSMKFNDQDADVGRKTVIEVKDAGTTKVEVPADAKAKIEAK